MIFFSGCKINIGLYVIRKRADGYHDLETVMFPVRGLCDAIEMIPGDKPGVEFSSSGLAVDGPVEKNLCVRAYELMRRNYPIGNVKMHLHKHIPMGAGLGGGSANAACVIKGLSQLFDLKLSLSTMESLAAELGSDTAFFVADRPALATGRGEILSPIELSMKGYRLVIVKPNVGVSTAEAYAHVTPHMPETALTEQLVQPVELWKDVIGNDFEMSVFPQYPQIAEIKQQLYEMGALYASMSGSGSAVYGIFSGDRGVVQADFSECFVYQEDMA